MSDLREIIVQNEYFSTLLLLKMESYLVEFDKHEDSNEVPEDEINIKLTKIKDIKDNYMKVVSNWNVMLVGQM